MWQRPKSNRQYCQKKHVPKAAVMHSTGSYLTTVYMCHHHFDSLSVYNQTCNYSFDVIFVFLNYFRIRTCKMCQVFTQQ